jgi:hypothetical protein
MVYLSRNSTEHVIVVELHRDSDDASWLKDLWSVWDRRDIASASCGCGDTLRKLWERVVAANVPIENTGLVWKSNLFLGCQTVRMLSVVIRRDCPDGAVDKLEAKDHDKGLTCPDSNRMRRIRGSKHSHGSRGKASVCSLVGSHACNCVDEAQSCLPDIVR